MIVDLINKNRATLNDDEYNVQLKSTIEPIMVTKYQDGGDSIEIMRKMRRMLVRIKFINGSTKSLLCDRITEEFGLILFIKQLIPNMNFNEQIEFKLEDIESILVE